MFTELLPLVRGRAIVLTIAAGEGDTLRVNVIPKAIRDTESAALTMPLSVTATAAELDADFPAALTRYATQHQTIAASLAAATADMETAERKDREATQQRTTAARNRTTAAAKTTGTHPATATGASPSTGSSAPTAPAGPVPAPTASAPASETLNLFDPLPTLVATPHEVPAAPAAAPAATASTASSAPPDTTHPSAVESNPIKRLF